MLSVEQLTCIREERILFENLNFSISPGEIIQIEGPNGAGKTSLLRILAGLSQPYEGNVRYDNNKIHRHREWFNSQLLYIGHQPGVKGEMSAQENLAFSLALNGLDESLAEPTLAQVNLFGFEDTLASHLSAGQHRRIALAQLWKSQAKLWILDEPFTAIDKKGVQTIEQMLLAHARKGGIVILTTHQDLTIPTDLYRKISLTYRFA